MPRGRYGSREGLSRTPKQPCDTNTHEKYVKNEDLTDKKGFIFFPLDYQKRIFKKLYLCFVLRIGAKCN